MGDLKENSEKPEGFGILVTKDGAMYEGNWLDGKQSGKGRWIHPQGQIYNGELIDDLANGKGIYT